MQKSPPKKQWQKPQQKTNVQLENERESKSLSLKEAWIEWEKES